jgi:hypothetical protein
VWHQMTANIRYYIFIMSFDPNDNKNIPALKIACRE